MRTAPTVALLGIVIMQGACATIAHGTTQVVPITSSPSGANVTVDSVALGRTPVNATVTRGRLHELTIAPDSGASFAVTLETTVSPWVFGNFFTYMFPVLLDFSNGAAYDVSPSAVHIVFPGAEAGVFGAKPGFGITGGDRVRMLTTASRDSFVYATINSVAADRWVVRRSVNATAVPTSDPDTISTADIQRLDVSHAPRRGVSGQVAMRMTSRIAVGTAALLTQDAVGTLFIGALYNIVAIPVGYFLGYAGASNGWSPREAHHVGSTLVVGDRVRVRVSGSDTRLRGRLLDLDGTGLLIQQSSKDPMLVPRASVVSVERLGGLNFKKATFIAFGVGAAIGLAEASKSTADANSRVVLPLAGAALALYSFPSFAPRRWVKVLKF